MPAPPLRFLPAAPAALAPPITDGEIIRLLIEERDAMDAAARRLAAMIDHLHARERAAAAPRPRHVAPSMARAMRREFPDA